ncbi:PE family protein, partial [Mycobacterium marinum]|uniref:PE family protein n=1 Tax=Mycobacterium marinum TaxID=1781 RepID=UPI003561D2B5
MSYVFAAHELMAVAAGELNDVGALVGSANTAAASTTDLMAAAGDEVSLAIARVFGAYGRDYQAFGVQAAEFHERFVQALRAGAGAYGAAEAAGASSLQSLETDLLGLINAPTMALFGRALIGNGANGAAGTGAAGG